jgi:hypothetical protein
VAGVGFAVWRKSSARDGGRRKEQEQRNRRGQAFTKRRLVDDRLSGEAIRLYRPGCQQ